MTTFVDAHAKQYGHTLSRPVEVVNLNVDIELPSNIEFENMRESSRREPKATKFTEVIGVDQPVPVYQRDQLGLGKALLGPALIVEKVSTTWLKKGWQAEIDTYGNLKLSFVNTKVIEFC